MQKPKMCCRKLVRSWYSMQEKKDITLDVFILLSSLFLFHKSLILLPIFSEMEECHRKIALVLHHNTFTLNSPQTRWMFSRGMLNNIGFLNTLLFPSPVSLYFNTFKSSPDCVLLLLGLGFSVVCLECWWSVCFKVNEHQRHLEESRSDSQFLA